MITLVSLLLSITVVSESMPSSPSHSAKKSMTVDETVLSLRAKSRSVPKSLPSGISR